MDMSRREFLKLSMVTGAAVLGFGEWSSIKLSAADRLSLMVPGKVYPVNNAGQMASGQDALVDIGHDGAQKLEVGAAIQQAIERNEMVAVGRIINKPSTGNEATPDYVTIGNILGVSLNPNNVMIFNVAALNGTRLAFSEFDLALMKVNKNTQPNPQDAINQLPTRVQWQASMITKLTKVGE